MQLKLALKRVARSCAADASCSGPISLAGVLMRSRASAVASAIRVMAATSMPSGGPHPAVKGVGVAIAAEAITAERKRERGETRVVRRIGEAIDTGRQQSRQ